MLPVVVVDFDSGASDEQQRVVLEACNRALTTSECATRSDGARRATRAVAAVSWRSPERVHLELGVRALDRWVTHEIEFARDEPASERWRAIGLSIATLVGEDTTTQPREHATPADTTPSAPAVEHSASRFGLRLGPRVSVGIDRPTVLAGAEALTWVSASPVWTPLLGLSYSIPLEPLSDVHWRELEVSGGAALRQGIGPLELREALLVSATRIAVSDGSEALSAWVPGAQVSLESRWPRGRWWTVSARIHTRLNDGATGIAKGGETVGSSPAWLVGGGLGLELQL